MDYVAVLGAGQTGVPDGSAWALRGVTSRERYVTRAEHEALAARQPPLGRPEAPRAALIPIRKTAAWWARAQDERRAGFEARAHHLALGLGYLPRVARRLHHGRELGEPFDSLTWFEDAPSAAAAFEPLVARPRATAGWSFVEREIDLRLSRVAAPEELSNRCSPGRSGGWPVRAMTSQVPESSVTPLLGWCAARVARTACRARRRPASSGPASIPAVSGR